MSNIRLTALLILFLIATTWIACAQVRQGQLSTANKGAPDLSNNQQTTRTHKEPVRTGADQRVQPPDDIDCPRNDLTAFIGKITSLQRGSNSIKITIETDWDTKETRELHYSNDEELFKQLRINGEPFKQEDWALIELPDGRPRPNLRATVWACGVALNQVVKRIDWQPPKKD